MDYLNLLLDYGGVLIGFVILVIAVYLLPSSVRWYVASAGIAVLGFRIWQIYTTKEKFKAWDEKQQKLTQDFTELKAERDKLSTEVNELSEQLVGLEQKRDTLQQQSDELAQQGDALATESQKLKQKVQEATEAAKQTDAKISHLKNAQTLIDRTEKLLNGQAEITDPNISDEALMKIVQGIK